MDQLASNVESIPSVALQGFPNYRRAKSGEYRIIFQVDAEKLILYVILLGKRNDDEIYRMFLRTQ